MVNIEWISYIPVLNLKQTIYHCFTEMNYFLIKTSNKFNYFAIFQIHNHFYQFQIHQILNLFTIHKRIIHDLLQWYWCNWQTFSTIFIPCFGHFSLTKKISAAHTKVNEFFSIITETNDCRMTKYHTCTDIIHNFLSIKKSIPWSFNRISKIKCNQKKKKNSYKVGLVGWLIKKLTKKCPIKLK